MLTEVDVCSSNPCRHEGTCHHSSGVFTCSCGTGYTGPMCENGKTNTSPASHQDVCVVVALNPPYIPVTGQHLDIVIFLKPLLHHVPDKNWLFLIMTCFKHFNNKDTFPKARYTFCVLSLLFMKHYAQTKLITPTIFIGLNWFTCNLSKCDKQIMFTVHKDWFSWKICQTLEYAASNTWIYMLYIPLCSYS